MTGMIRFPFFMRNRKKIDILEGMIKQIKKGSNENKCYKCGIKFEKWMGRWGGGINEFMNGHRYCIYCHGNLCNMRRKDFISEKEKKEFTKVKQKLQDSKGEKSELKNRSKKNDDELRSML
jgi:hypothetical protein